MAKRRRVNRRQPKTHVSAFGPCLTYNIAEPNDGEVFTPKPRAAKKVDVTIGKDGKLIMRVWK